MEREENIQEWFRRLHRKELNFSLLNHQIHVTCYKSLVRDLQKISTIIKKERSTVLKNYSQSSNINPVLTDITNNQPTTTYDPYFFSTTTDTNVLFNTPFSFRNRNRDLNTTTSINSFLNDDKEVS